jgi:hypothetical protein
MDPDAPAGPAAKPDRQNTSASGAAVHAAAGADQVLVLSPGVTLTLGEDALLMSGMSVFMAERGGSIFVMIKTDAVCLCQLYRRPACHQTQSFMFMYWKSR